MEMFFSVLGVVTFAYWLVFDLGERLEGRR